MRWNLRMVAAQQGIWKAADLRRALGEAGLQISAGKMSHLWSGRPITVRLDDLDVICHVLSCQPNDLLVPDPVTEDAQPGTSQASGVSPTIRPSRPRGGRTPPPA